MALALLVLGALLFSNVAYAASTTVKGHPVLNSGSGSAFTQNPSWSGSTYITRLNTTTYTFSGNNVATVVLAGTKTVIPSTCTVTATVTLQSATGSTLASASTNVARAGTTFSTTVNPTDVYYHTIASIAVAFTQTGTC
ncbi:MAG: hypothetical protein Q8O40_02380 [Chloroflexota bacterium]|nr:hypothetical protein [Chloroflexota bacterium]